MTNPRALALQRRIVRIISEAGGSITEPELFVKLGSRIDRARVHREIKDLMQTKGQVVRITRDGVTRLRIPTRSRLNA